MESSPLGPIVDIPLDLIRVLNPRVRGKKQHEAMVESISAVGLKRPITVSRCRDADGSESYDLVCGQGRLEAVRKLGDNTIPAVVVEKDESECLMASLVENIARRNHSTHELLQDIESLKQAGYRDEQIAEKVGLSVGYLQSVLFLLTQGEERLLAAVDSGALPIAFAVTIARSSDAEVQAALADAYAEGALKGRQLGKVRRLIERRAGGRNLPKSGPCAQPRTRKLTPEHLRRMYLLESEKQRVLVKKAEVAHARLAFIVQAMRELLRNPEFISILKQEGLSTMPRILEQRLTLEQLS